MVAIVDVPDGAVRFQHPSDDPGNEWSVHPVKRRRERNDSKSPEISGQVFGPGLNPPGVHHAPLRRKPSRLLDHYRVGVESNDLPEKASERECHRARPAADIEKPTSTVKPERLLQRTGEPRSVRETPTVIVGGSSGEQRLVPLPLEPLAGHQAILTTRRRASASPREPARAAAAAQPLQATTGAYHRR